MPSDNDYAKAAAALCGTEWFFSDRSAQWQATLLACALQRVESSEAAYRSAADAMLTHDLRSEWLRSPPTDPAVVEEVRLALQAQSAYRRELPRLELDFIAFVLVGDRVLEKIADEAFKRWGAPGSRKWSDLAQHVDAHGASAHCSALRRPVRWLDVWLKECRNLLVAHPRRGQRADDHTRRDAFAALSWSDGGYDWARADTSMKQLAAKLGSHFFLGASDPNPIPDAVTYLNYKRVNSVALRRLVPEPVSEETVSDAVRTLSDGVVRLGDADRRVLVHLLATLQFRVVPPLELTKAILALIEALGGPASPNWSEDGTAARA